MWNWVAGLAFKLVGQWLDAKNANDDLKKQWLGFVDAVDKSSLDSSNVLSSYQQQLAQLRAAQGTKDGKPGA